MTGAYTRIYFTITVSPGRKGRQGEMEELEERRRSRKRRSIV